MVFDPSIYRNVSSRTLASGCHDCAEDEPREELTFEPTILYFQFLNKGLTSGPQPFTITNTGDLPVGVSDIHVTGDFELVGDLPAALDPGEEFEVNIVFKPTHDGARTGDLIVDAGTIGPQAMVKLIGIGGDDASLQGTLLHLQEEIDALVGVNNAQSAAITALQQLLAGFVPETTLYMWRAYSNSPDGTVDFTTGAPGSRSYIGLAFNRLTNTPSDDPQDYEWSLIKGVIGNVISWDTENVGGRPAQDILTDLTNLSNALLAYTFNNQEILDYVNGLLYVDGHPVNTVIANLSNQMVDGDNALAETLGILGATNGDHTAFILNLNQVYVSPTQSLAQRLTNINAATETTEAHFQELQQAIAEADYAVVSDLALLGAKTNDGTAWIMNLDSVKVSPTATLAQHISTLVASAAGGAASVTELYEAVVEPDGSAHAKAVLQLDVNGRVVGYSATNDGTYGQIVFNFDSFVIRHPGTGLPVFTVEGGIVKMTNVEIDTLKVGSVITGSIAAGAVTDKKEKFVALGGAQFNNTNTWNVISGLAVTFTGTPAATKSTIRTYVNVKRDGGSNDLYRFRVMRKIGGGAIQQVGEYVRGAAINIQNTSSWEWSDIIPIAGDVTYSVEIMNENDDDTKYYDMKLIVDIGKR